MAYDGAVEKATAAWRGGHVHVWTCGHMDTALVWCRLGVASAHLRTGTLWWYQMRGRQAKLLSKYIAFA